MKHPTPSDLLLHPARVISITAHISDSALRGHTRDVLQKRASFTTEELSEMWTQQLEALRSRCEALRADNVALLATAAPHARRVLSAASPTGVHVALLRECLELVRFPQADYIIGGLLRGFPILGDIPAVPQAPLSVVRKPELSVDELWERAPALRTRLVARQAQILAKTPLASPAADDLRELLRQARDDVNLGRITPLIPAAKSLRPLGTRRFGVTQHTSKGKLKLRSIDDFAESLVNHTTSVRRRISMAQVDELVSIIHAHLLAHRNKRCKILKSDFRSAYRSVPILKEHLDASDVLVIDPDMGRILSGTQLAMPFGAVGAVYSWDWVSDGIVSIIRSLFLIPVLKYVDDLFTAELEELADRAREVIIEVVTLLGFVLAEDKTPPPASVQDVLGVEVSVGDGVVHLAVDSSKATYWLEQLKQFVVARQLSHPQAQTLAGRLSFGCHAVWGRFPRLRLSLLYRMAAGLPVDPQALMVDLAWWRRFLAEQNSRRIDLFPTMAPVVVYSDASGSGGCGALLLDGQEALWFGASCTEIQARLEPRLTQINAFELFTVLLALALWPERLAERRVIWLVDNTVALGAMKKGTSSASDLASIAHAIWRRLRSLRVAPHVFWVPSKLNLADAPSRGAPAVLGTRVPMTLEVSSVLSDALDSRTASHA